MHKSTSNCAVPPLSAPPPCSQAAAKIVLQDWNDGRIPYYTVPPQRQSEVEGSAALVQQWGQEFNADEVGGPLRGAPRVFCVGWQRVSRVGVSQALLSGWLAISGTWHAGNPQRPAWAALSLSCCQPSRPLPTPAVTHTNPLASLYAHAYMPR